jgi:hypothetical protein
MAIRHIREAYNQEAGNHSICRGARLDYVSAGPGQPQKQVITFDIVRFDGTAETVKTPLHEMADDPHEQARQLAKTLKAHDKFIDDQAPEPYTPPPIDAPQEKWTAVKNAPPIPRPKPAPAPQSEPPPPAPVSLVPPVNTAPKIPPNPWIE